MDKRAIVDLIIEHLAAEVNAIAEASRDARDASTHEEARAEDKYDTRATESSYLANGQARVAADFAEALEYYRTLAIRDFGPDEPIAVTALVQVEQRSFRDWYFLGPRAGGVAVKIDGTEIMVVTPQSPLGRELLGRTAGASIHLEGGREAKILAVR